MRSPTHVDPRDMVLSEDGYDGLRGGEMLPFFPYSSPSLFPEEQSLLSSVSPGTFPCRFLALSFIGPSHVSG